MYNFSQSVLVVKEAESEKHFALIRRIFYVGMGIDFGASGSVVSHDGQSIYDVRGGGK